MHSYNTRVSSSRNFFIKQSKLQIQFKSFARFGARTWNEIPTSLREKPKNIFEIKLHEALLDVLHQHDDNVDYLPNRQSSKIFDGQIISLAKETRTNGKK